MATDAQDIYETALALPEEGRADLADRLLQSLKPPGHLSENDPGFANEIDRRIEAYRAGETTASDWDSVSERMGRVSDERPSQ